uniref:hypothetical protein n=1 Tax=Roseivirga sp. TaxID=1964215 RepID=UPI004047A772
MNEKLKQELIEFHRYISNNEWSSEPENSEAWVDGYLKSINCLEANPKALNSMKCDGNYCSCDDPTTKISDQWWCIVCDKAIELKEQL